MGRAQCRPTTPGFFLLVGRRYRSRELVYASTRIKPKPLANRLASWNAHSTATIMIGSSTTRTYDPAVNGRWIRDRRKAEKPFGAQWILAEPASFAICSKPSHFAANISGGTSVLTLPAVFCAYRPRPCGLARPSMRSFRGGLGIAPCVV